MIKFKPGQEPRVFAYRNLHKDCFSFKDCKTGRVTYRGKIAVMRDVKFAVGIKGRLKVILEKSKNVHAGIRGYLTQLGGPGVGTLGPEIAYNPYKSGNFYFKESGCPVYEADAVILLDNKVYLLEHTWASDAREDS